MYQKIILEGLCSFPLKGQCFFKVDLRDEWTGSEVKGRENCCQAICKSQSGGVIGSFLESCCIYSKLILKLLRGSSESKPVRPRTCSHNIMPVCLFYVTMSLGSGMLRQSQTNRLLSVLLPTFTNVAHLPAARLERGQRLLTWFGVV
ncbi:hypothetical protein CHARACLAT_003151 [Characodon lateralis]|uniref:Uncharacterized protein n=1 Tax=Characodon lateralis TaxID=208331 RepID=A0ABU7CY71_9TELE|nr:hypothetical protein [Characodon lateralis]